MAPIVIDNTVIVGTGNDLDSPGYIQSFDPETGEVLWRFYTVPMKAGDPGLDTWPSLQAARYGGGHPWLPGVYDPETNLYIFGTGNPIPAYTVGRGEGDNLFTCSLIAVDVETGKMKWYFQTSPHDMHDWDSAQTPVLFEGDGRRQDAQAGVDRGAQRLLLHARPDDRRADRRHEVRQRDQLGQSIDKKGSVRRDPIKDPDRRRRPDLAHVRRHDQLGAAGLLAGHGAVLRLRAQRLLDLLPDRSRSARLDGPRRQGGSRRRQHRQLPDGDRSDDRQDRLAASVSAAGGRACTAAAAAAC